MLFKHKGRNYAILSVQFGQNGPASDIVGIVFDVTGLPDTTKVREVGRIKDPTHKGGSHEAFTYKHSDGRPIFFTTVASQARYANMYDLEKFLAGDPAFGLIGPVGRSGLPRTARQGHGVVGGVEGAQVREALPRELQLLVDFVSVGVLLPVRQLV